MASYSSPTIAYVEARCGLNTSIEGIDQTALDARITAVLSKAEARIALAVGEATFDSSSLTARQVTALQDAVSLRTGVLYLRGPTVEKATGTQEEVLMEESDRIRQLALDMEGESEELVALFETGSETTPFSLPGVRSSTFISTTSKTPVEKLARLDERDDIFAGADLT